MEAFFIGFIGGIAGALTLIIAAWASDMISIHISKGEEKDA